MDQFVCVCVCVCVCEREREREREREGKNEEERERKREGEREGKRNSEKQKAAWPQNNPLLPTMRNLILSSLIGQRQRRAQADLGLKRLLPLTSCVTLQKSLPP